MYIKTVCAVQFWNQYSVFYDPFTAAKSWPNLTAYEADIIKHFPFPHNPTGSHKHHFLAIAQSNLTRYQENFDLSAVLSGI